MTERPAGYPGHDARAPVEETTLAQALDRFLLNLAAYRSKRGRDPVRRATWDGWPHFGAHLDWLDILAGKERLREDLVKRIARETPFPVESVRQIVEEVDGDEDEARRMLEEHAAANTCPTRRALDQDGPTYFDETEIAWLNACPPGERRAISVKCGDIEMTRQRDRDASDGPEG